MTRDLQDSVLAHLGAAPAEAAELRAYNQNVFDVSESGGLSPATRFPLPDEPFVAFWEGVAEESRTRGAFAVLRERLPQLAFPIREGISRTAAYRDATLRGVPVAALPAATGLELEPRAPGESRVLAQHHRPFDVSLATAGIGWRFSPRSHAPRGNEGGSPSSGGGDPRGLSK